MADRQNDDAYDCEVLDCVAASSSKLPRISVGQATVHTVCVDRKRLDADVAAGQQKMFMAYAQFRRDVTRCRFHMAGRLMRRLPQNLPATLVRYCTQAVLGLPVEMLHHSNYLVAELADRQPMLIFASERDVTVKKCLRCRHFDSTPWHEVEILVWASVADPTALVSYRFE